MITRFFHPVGQGAFYSERHKGFNIVYDCGELHNKKSAKEVVKQAFNSETIDILFISHLDYDHISLIDTLKANNTIKKVVLPLTQEDGKILSIASCIRGEKTISDNLINLILNPYAYFGKDTEILGVRPYKTEYYDNSNLRPLDSGIPIEKPQKGSLLDDDWCFIPYNIQSFSRTQLFNLYYS